MLLKLAVIGFANPIAELYRFRGWLRAFFDRSRKVSARFTVSLAICVRSA